MNGVELGHGGPDAGQRAVLLARAVCTDAALYGGHACLPCQAVARELVARAGDPDLPPVRSAGARPGAIEAPPHGTSQRTSRSHWARVLSTIAGSQSALTAALATGDGASG